MYSTRSADLVRMMARTLTPEPLPSGAPSETGLAGSAESDTGEFEFVLGRRQVASVTFLTLVLLAVCAGGSYLIGKGTATVSASELPPAPAAAVPVEAPAPPPMAAPVVPVVDKPLFAEPLQGVIYIQMGAVEKGIAEIFAEGLRKRAFTSFVATGPNDHIFRVLIGPFRSGDEYQAAKKALDGMGLETFARRYEQ